MPVRRFREEDIPQVADLYWTVLRERTGPCPVELQSSLHELYFENPWLDGPQRALVFNDQDTITGFLGVVPRRMSLGGQSVLAAVGGNFVVHPAARTTPAGLSLLQSYMSAGQDLSLTDSANDVSRTLLERLGFRTILAFSVHWIRVLRPARFATNALSQVARNPIVTSMAFVAKPFCAIVDHLAGNLSLSPFRPTEPSLESGELDVETLLQCLQEFRSGHSLWPEYDGNSLTWLLGFMARTMAHGDELRKVVLYDQKKKIVGWYLYFATAGGIGEVVQVGGDRRSITSILDHLFWDAWNNGVIALCGVVDRHNMPEFSEKNCFFSCRGGWMVAHSRKPALLETLSDGDAVLSRLDGEWCLALGTRYRGRSTSMRDVQIRHLRPRPKEKMLPRRQEMILETSTGVEVLNKVRTAFQSAFNVDPESITMETSPADISRWDSMGHVNLAICLEKTFGLTFDVDDLMAMENVKEICRVLNSKLAHV